MTSPDIIDAEHALVQRLRAGEPEACAQCVELHAAGIYRLALRMVRDEREAEDVMQETLLSAFKAIRSFDGRSRLHTWLFRIAYNASLMRLRRKEPELISMDADPEDDSETSRPVELADWSRLPDQVFEAAAARAELESTISALPRKLREVFVLRELEELSTEETAQTLGVSVQVVKTRLHRARLWLRERLAAYFNEFALAS